MIDLELVQSVQFSAELAELLVFFPFFAAPLVFVAALVFQVELVSVAAQLFVLPFEVALVFLAEPDVEVARLVVPPSEAALVFVVDQLFVGYQHLVFQLVQFSMAEPHHLVFVVHVAANLVELLLKDEPPKMFCRLALRVQVLQKHNLHLLQIPSVQLRHFRFQVCCFFQEYTSQFCFHQN
jgi:hypothetical protein